ncbi:hypothetical protein [Phytoactinopolyspora endophytica]|uniref:hypothetical protein n=1 Tax=Phytoactinopolyspora endophytica TaxID=1642495 RepID=UPI00101BD854|nr:hypothetical protein [Phytoactinopolyspora endophytica]
MSNDGGRGRTVSAGSPVGMWMRFYAAGWVHLIAVFFAVGAVFVYLFGLLGLVRLEYDWRECTNWRYGTYERSGPPAFVRLDDSYFPLSAVCHWDDGSTLDHVPAFVNPAVALCIAATITAVAIIVFQNRRERRDMIDDGNGHSG